MIKVLIVDDDFGMRRVLRKALSKNENFEVIGEAENGVVGLELFKEEKSFRLIKQKGDWQLICHGLSPGYETYASGWHSLIISTLNKEQI